MKGPKTAPGENQFPADLWVTAPHESQQFNLLLAVRRKIGMPSFGRRNSITRAIPNKKRLPQSGPSGQQRSRPARLRFTRIQYTEILGLHVLDAVPGCAKIIEQHNVWHL